MPVIKDMYDGIRGKTQGDTNDKKPPINAMGMETSCVICSRIPFVAY
jgi:hypothetical protein